jgi:hypothetical protein
MESGSTYFLVGNDDAKANLNINYFVQVSGN